MHTELKSVDESGVVAIGAISELKTAVQKSVPRALLGNGNTGDPMDSGGTDGITSPSDLE